MCVRPYDILKSLSFGLAFVMWYQFHIKDKLFVCFEEVYSDHSLQMFVFIYNR